MSEPLTRPAASAAVESLGWRLLLGTLALSVPVDSLARGLEVAAAAVDACGPDADEHLRVDVRPDRVELVLQTLSRLAVTGSDVRLAERVHAAIGGLGLPVSPPARAGAGSRPVQVLEVCIDALDIPGIRPFWRAVLGYVDEPGDMPDAVVDPAGQGPSFWFQQLDEPRPQRNRIHFDIVVSHDEAEGRIRAALDAGGRVIGDAEARAFWILADAEGNEICVCTWQDRDD